MPVRVPNEAALAVAVKLEHALAAFPRSRWTGPAAWHTAHADLQRLILAEGGTFQDGVASPRVTILGFRASSTEGLPAACRNWIVQVRAKAALPAGEAT